MGEAMINWTDILKNSTFKSPRELLIDRYVNKRLSLSEVALELDVSPPTVRNYLVQMGIERRARGGDNSTKPVDITLEDYQTMTYKELAKKYNVSPYTIWARTRGFPSKS